MKYLLCLFGAILPFCTFGVTFHVTSVADSGLGTLRQAILDANLTPGREDIAFNLPGPGPHSIVPLSPLPAVTDPVAIDGATQPGFAGKPVIELNGRPAGASANGLWITAGNSSVRGLAINGFGLSGILIETKGSNVLVGNFIGTGVDGTTDAGNLFGISIISSSNNTVGLSGAAGRNVVSGNSSTGIRLQSAMENVIEGNYIGTDVTGAFALANGSDGISLISGSDRNTIGGLSSGAGNLISGNTGNGIFASFSTGNVIEGNFIGTDLNGSFAIANGLCGVNFRNAATNNVGAAGVNARNLISGNGVHGIEISGSGSIGNVVQGNYIGIDRTGAQRVANRGSGIYMGGAVGNLIGGDEPAARNIISGSFNNGIHLEFAHSNSIAGNFIGLDASGAARIRNSGQGIQLSSASFNTIGSTDPGGRNVVSGNSQGGISISSPGMGNVVQGNYIGTDATGSARLDRLGNQGSGISVSGSQNTIGGDEMGAGNVISANDAMGAVVLGNSNVLQGNLIGLDSSGLHALPNGTNHFFHAGIFLGGEANTVGGAAPSAGNVIAGNLGNGIYLSGAVRCVVEGNYIGVDATGARPLPNTRHGLLVGSASHGNSIGGVTQGANLIGGNTLAGIRISGAVSNVIQGNSIGVAVSGLPLANAASGIELADSAMGNLIGGTSGGEGNRIAHNGRDGILVEGTTTAGNAIRGNSIFANGGLGVNLRPEGEAQSTPTPNDEMDSDTGPHGLQNFPVITNVVYTGSSSAILQGFLRSTPDASFELDFFSNSRNEPTGFGEGELYLGTTTVDTDGSGFAEFSWVRSGSFSNQNFTTTATDVETDNTSEFSPAAGGLRITQISHGGGNISVSFTTLPGRQHRLEFTTSLSGAVTWQAVPGGENVSGTGSVVTIQHTGVSGSSTLFYRVRLLP